MIITGSLSIGQCLAKISGNLNNAKRCFLCFFEFLLDGVFFGFECQDGSVALRKLIQVALGLFGGNKGEFCGHEVAYCADVMFVIDTGYDPVEEFGGVGAAIGGVDTCV